MAYNSNKGTQNFGDIHFEGDPAETQIDFEDDLIALKTKNIQRLIISSSAITASVIFSASAGIHAGTFTGDGAGITGIPASGVGAAGSNTQVQYNNGNAFAGSSNMVFDGTTLTVAGLSSTGNSILGDASGDSLTINAETIDIPNVAAGTDNTVVVYNGSTLLTDEIDSRVWGTTLLSKVAGVLAEGNITFFTNDSDTVTANGGLTYLYPRFGVTGSVSASLDVISLRDVSGSRNVYGGGVYGVNLSASNNLSAGGNLTVSGDATLGDVAGDSITLNAQTINIPNVAAGTDNTVVVYNGSTLVTDEIDSRVWESYKLIERSGTPTGNQVGVFNGLAAQSGYEGFTYVNNLRLAVSGAISGSGDVSGLNVSASSAVTIGGVNQADSSLYVRAPSDNSTVALFKSPSNDTIFAMSGSGRIVVGGSGAPYLEGKFNITGTVDDKLITLKSDTGEAFYVSGSGDTFVSGNIQMHTTMPMIEFTSSHASNTNAQIGINNAGNILLQNNTQNQHIVLKANDQGTIKEGFRLDGAVPEVVVNQTSDSLVNFRVESDNNTHMLYVDGSEDKIGINTDTPSVALDINSDAIRIRSSNTPSSATDFGTQGEIRWDGNYIYICIATDTWRRVAHSTW